MTQQHIEVTSHHTHRAHQEQEEEKQRRQLRWFFAWVYTIALLGSIGASVIIAIVTKNPLPALVPSALLLAMRPIIRWVYSDGGRMTQRKRSVNSAQEHKEDEDGTH